MQPDPQVMTPPPVGTDAPRGADAAPFASGGLRGIAFRREHYIISPHADWLWLIGSPLVAFVLGFSLSGTQAATEPVSLLGNQNTLTGMFMGTLIMAHLFIVFFRSHANPAIYKLYPWRFGVAPFVLFLAMGVYAEFAIYIGVLATWWDVYHSSLQTFGIGRIYDMRAGNDPKAGRQLDRMLNLLIYAGPILGGATLMSHIETDVDLFAASESVFFRSIPAHAESYAGELTFAVLAIAPIVICSYLAGYYRLYQRGYRISGQKLALLVITAVVSIWSWGFNTFGEAFLIMNFFHAVQYFAIVWWSEKKRITNMFGVGQVPYGPAIAFVAFIVVAAAYGSWAEFFGSSTQLAFNLTIVISILHFWYDGFIWSVQKSQVS